MRIERCDGALGAYPDAASNPINNRSCLFEQPIQVFKTDGYANLIETFVGAEAYSFVFDGQLGYLDHALAMVKEEMKTRRDIYEWDAMAWVLYKSKKFDEAQKAFETFLNQDSGAIKIIIGGVED